jgi:ribosomal protein L16 Arg81 hydroxylase
MIAELQPLFDFFRAQRTAPPASGHAYAQGVLHKKPIAFFSVEKLQAHLNNPLLNQDWITLYKQGARIPLEQYMLWKTVLGKRLMFMDKTRLNNELADGAAILLEGVDVLDTDINAFVGEVDAQMPCALSNAVAFFSQKGHEAYKGHRDTDDVLVIQISGQKIWEIFAPQQRRYQDNNDLSRAEMGPLAAKITMNAGDALFVRAGVPHICQTPAAHSLHLSFDLIDRTPNIEQITNEANKFYNKSAATPHVSAADVATRYVQLLQSPDFSRVLTQATVAVGNDAKAFRNRIGKAQAITALNKFKT